MFRKQIKLTMLNKLITLTCITVASALCTYFIKVTFDNQREQLESDAKKVKLIIEDEVFKFQYGLQGAKGIVSTFGNRPSQQIFRKYSESRTLFSNFKASLGFGYIRKVSNNNLEKYANEKKSFFSIHPTIKSNHHFIIELIEPWEKNQDALGSDIAFEKNREQAALLSARTGLATLTKKITLVQKGKNNLGFLYLMPIYKTALTPENESERLSSLIGWSYTPIILEDLFAEISKKIPQNLMIDLKLDKNENPIEIVNAIKEKQIFSLEKDLEISAGENIWRIRVKPNDTKTRRAIFSFITIYLLSLFLILITSHLTHKYIQSKNKSISDKTKWMNAIIESAAHAVISTKPDGTIMTFNNTAEKMLGYTAEEFIGKQTLAFIHDPVEIKDSASRLSQDFGILIEPGFEVLVLKTKTEESDTNEWTYTKKTGEKFRVRLCVTAIHDDENVLIGYLGIAEDLTEHNKLASLIEKQKEKMIESSKMSVLGEMAGGIAHEINNPLTIIIGKANQLLKNTVSGDLDSDVTIKIQDIKKTAERIDKIVKGLSLFSRNAGNDPFNSFAINSIVELTTDLCSEKIKFKQINLRTELTSDFLVYGRSTEISQVIMNIVCNAVDAIELQAEKWVEIKTYSLNEKNYISVTDSGSGIPDDLAQKIMNPFFTTKEIGKGTGLGLSISKGIIESHNGRLYLDQNSIFTRFIIELPKHNQGNQKLSA